MCKIVARVSKGNKMRRYPKEQGWSRSDARALYGTYGVRQSAQRALELLENDKMLFVGTGPAVK